MQECPRSGHDDPSAVSKGGYRFRIQPVPTEPQCAPAVRKHLRQIVRNEPDYAFAIFGSINGEPPHLTIDNRGRIKALVLTGVPKEDPM